MSATLQPLRFWWHRLWHGACYEKINRYRWAHMDAVRELDRLRAPYCPKCGQQRHTCGAVSNQPSGVGGEQ